MFVIEDVQVVQDFHWRLRIDVHSLGSILVSGFTTLYVLGDGTQNLEIVLFCEASVRYSTNMFILLLQVIHSFVFLNIAACHGTLSSHGVFLYMLSSLRRYVEQEKKLGCKPLCVLLINYK